MGIRWHVGKAIHSLSAHRFAVRAASLILLVTLEFAGQSQKSKSIPDSLTFRNTAPGVHYVGSKLCAGCHSPIYQQFSRTSMARSTFLPGKIVDLGWLTKPVDVFNQKHNRHYQIFERDSKIFQSEYAVDEQGKEIFRHTEELAYMVGTGVNGDTPLIRRGNYLFEAPLSYYAATKAWDLSPNFDVRDMGFNLPITADCIGCHAGRTQPVLGKDGMYNDPPVIELGINCESCHGPGELHVKQRLSGAPLSGMVDRSIVNPAKLPPWLADNICMSCHEGDIRALQPGRYDSDFRPGTPLNDTVAILKAPIDPRTEQSPLLEHYYSMTLSRCYRESGGKMGCQSCHDPHVQPSQEEAPDYFRSQCLRCHTQKSCSLDMEKRLAQHPPDACTNCHMPKQPALTVSHSALTEHRITRAPNEAFPKIAFEPSLPGTGFIHVNAVPGKPDTVPPVVLLRAYRKELIREHLEFKDHYFSLLDRLAKAGSKDPFVLSAIAQKAGGDDDLPRAISYAKQAIALGATSDSDYLLLDGFLARSGSLDASVDLLRKGIAITPYSNALYESLAKRELAAGNSTDGLATIQRGLELFPEDSALRSLQQQEVAKGLVQEGIAQFKQGDVRAAMEKFHTAVQTNPDDAVAHDYIGVIQGESGMLDEAIAEFRQAASLDSTFADPHFHLGLAYSRTGKTGEAITEYQEALRLNPAMPQAQYSLSAICAKLGDLDGAITLLRRVIKSEPDFAEAHYNLGLNLWNRYKNSPGLRQKSDIDEAAQELAAASRLDPGNPRAYFALGEILSDRGDLAPAIENLQKAVDLDPPNAEYHYNLGLTLKLKGNLDAARIQFRTALEFNPQHALAHRSLGLALRESGDLDAAAAELRIAVAELPNDAEGHHLLGTVLFKSNDLIGSIDESRQAISLDPALTDARATLAQALQKAGRKEEAQKEAADLRATTAENSKVGQAMLLVETAAGHAKKGEIKAAISELEQAVALNPRFVEAQYQLGVALQESGDLGRSEEAFRRVLELNPDHALAHLRLALQLEKQKDRTEARAEFIKAAQLAPSLVDAHAGLGRLALDSHDWATAATEFEAVLAWNPTDPAARRDLATALKASGQPERAAHGMEMAQPPLKVVHP